MRPILTDFSKWKKLNEGLFWDVVEKEPIAGTKHKVKVKYNDATSFKVKAVNDLDMVDANGNVNPSLMDGIVYFLKTHDGTDFAREYPQLQNLATFYKDNFFTYNVKKENDRRQVVVFTLQKRADFKGVNPSVKLISDDAAAALAQTPDAKNALAKSDQSLLQNTTQQTDSQSTGTIKLGSPIPLASITKYDSNSTFYKIFDNIVAAMSRSKVFTDPAASELINKTIDELDAKKLGENSTKLIKALIAGFGGASYTDIYGRTKEQTEITQEMFNKMASFFQFSQGDFIAGTENAVAAAGVQNSSRKYYLGLNGKMLVEQTAPPATLPMGFDMTAFLKSITGGASSTGNITIPTNGFKRGVVTKGDTELKKAQQLLIDKLKPVLGDDPTFKKFMGYGADGDFGPTTETIVAAAKAGFELKDQDGSTITKELIDKLLTDKITESYIGVNGKLFEKFNVEAAKKVFSSYTPTKKTDVKKEETSTETKDETKKVGDSKWIEEIKTNLETFGTVEIGNIDDGSKYIRLYPKGGDPTDHLDVYGNKRVWYPTKNQTYKGTISQDGNSITLDGGKKLGLSAFLKDPASVGEVDVAAEQGKQVWLSPNNEEGYANVRMDSDDVNTVIYKHDDKTKSIGILTSTTKDRSGYTWYTVTFPKDVSGYKKGRVRSDLVELRAAK